jgi:hypothetical protein
MSHYSKSTKKNDDYETPYRVLDMILDELDPQKVIIWEPFKGSGYSTEYMKSKGFFVTNGEFEDFFKHEKPPILGLEDMTLVVVTNPPYSIKKEILQKFKDLGIDKIALLVPIGTVFCNYFTKLFPQDNFQIIFHTGRVKFLDPATHQKVKGSCSFDVAWVCNGLNLKKNIQYKS